jgi:anti-sigma B factor antagonist
MNSQSGAALPQLVVATGGGHQPTVCLRGEVDVTTVGDIEAVLRELTSTRPPELVLDLQEVTFLDSAGVRLILQAHRWQNEAGHALTVIPGEGVVQRVFAVSGLTMILKIKSRGPAPAADPPEDHPP